LLAEREDRVKGIMLLDPVDNTSMTPAGKLLDKGGFQSGKCMQKRVGLA